MNIQEHVPVTSTAPDGTKLVALVTLVHPCKPDGTPRYTAHMIYEGRITSGDWLQGRHELYEDWLARVRANLVYRYHTLVCLGEWDKVTSNG